MMTAITLRQFDVNNMRDNVTSYFASPLLQQAYIDRSLRIVD